MFPSYRYLSKLLITFGLIIEINAGSNRKFRCNNGRFIDAKYFCDKDNDCGDRSDELFGCDRLLCGQGKFTCLDGGCVPAEKRCDTIKGCRDGSDEFNCDHELSVHNCTLQEHKFLCNDGLRCLRWNETCDGYPNCLDDSDETDDCYDYDADVCHRCPHPCLRTPKGPQCFYNFNNDTFHSNYEADIQECDIYNQMCTQRCVMYRGITQCSCGEHYKLTYDNNYYCRSNVSFGRTLLYTDSKSIKFLNITSRNSIILQNNVVTQAFTAAHNYIYWSVISDNRASIFKKPILDNQNDKSIFNDGREGLFGSIVNYEAKEIVNRNLNITSPITSIAVDWLAGNIYFTSSRWLYVCSNNGHLCTSLKNATSQIEYIALAPKYGFMFWAENDESYNVCIFKSAMDGSDEHALVEEKLRVYSSLVVDEASERVYWLDKILARVESIKFNGKGRKIERADARNFFSFAEFEASLYWTLEFNNTIFSDRQYENLIIKENSTVKQLFVYNPLLQRTQISNPCSSSPCKGMCLIRPSLMKELNYTCVCEHFQHANNTCDSQWCDSSQTLAAENEEEKHHTSTDRNSHNSVVMGESTYPTVALRPFTKYSMTTVKDSLNIEHPHVIQAAYDRSHSSDAAVSISVGVEILVVVVVIALLIGSYVTFNKWKEGRRSDSIRLMFTRREGNNDDL